MNHVAVQQENEEEEEIGNCGLVYSLSGIVNEINVNPTASGDSGH